MSSFLLIILDLNKGFEQTFDVTVLSHVSSNNFYNLHQLAGG